MTKKILSLLAGVIVLAAVLAWPAAAQSPIPTPTPLPPTATSVPPTATPIPPTATTVPPTATATPLPPTATLVLPTATSGPTSTPLPATPTTTVVPPTPTTAGPTPTSAPPTLAPPTPTTVPPTASATPVPPVPTPTRTPVPPPPPLPILGYHTVRYSESLFCIGRAYVVSPWAIATQNRIGYPYWLRIGQRLAIPNAPWRYMSAGPVCARQFGGPTPPPPPPGCRVTYTVRPGDTLYAIAGRYQSSVWAIVTANHLYNPNLIFPGQVLCIP